MTVIEVIRETVPATGIDVSRVLQENGPKECVDCQDRQETLLRESYTRKYYYVYYAS